MAEVDKKLSEYTTASGNLTANDLELVAVADQQSATGYSSRKITAINKAQDYLNTFLFPLLLNTTNKSIIGAINELAAGGGGGTASILTGTTAPTSAQGSDGNLYVQYTAGTGGASDIVDAMYVKLDGEWCEISTGGGTPSVTLTETLEAGETSITFTDAAITTNSKIEVLTSDINVRPNNATISTGTMTLFFTAQANDLTVQVEVT